MEVDLPSQQLLEDILWPWILCEKVSFGPDPREVVSPLLPVLPVRRDASTLNHVRAMTTGRFNLLPFYMQSAFLRTQRSTGHAQPFVQAVRHTTKMLSWFVFLLRNLFALHYGILSVLISSTNWALDRHVLD